jgi:hypothetical protein
LKEGLVKITLALFALGILTSAAAIMPVANAKYQALSLTSTQGPAGTFVLGVLYGFSPNSPLIVLFGSTEVVSGSTSNSDLSATTVTFNVPSVSPGTYTVTAFDSAGDKATAKFTVTSTATQTPTPTPTTTPTNPTATPWTYPTHAPTSTPVAKAAEFLSPLVIGAIVAVVIAVAFPVAFMYRRRGKQETLLEEEPLPYRPGPSAPSRRPTVNPRYNQPGNVGQQLSRPAVTTRYSQPSRYGQQKSYMKTCPRCQRNIRDDYNICPYCDKRLK